ncbi:MAG TPA: hypothetical protein VEW68_08175 [Patescibacteria group bacterium]|nr:hypothetical protein [Patescibacteria group bacterium]
MIQVLTSLGSNALALVAYPGLLAMAVFGAPLELAWTRLTTGRLERSDLPRRRPTLAVVVTGVCATLASVQLAAPFNPLPTDERNVVIAAIALAFTAWAGLTAEVDVLAEPGLLLAVQVCWLLAVLGPAVQPESLRPQVLGNLIVPGLLPLKIASGFLYLLCLPALLGLWPLAAPRDRRSSNRFEVGRGLCWFAYCGLFTTLFVTPSADDALGLLRFLAITIAAGAGTLILAWLARMRGPRIVRGFYSKAVPAYAAGVLALLVATSYLMH